MLRLWAFLLAALGASGCFSPVVPPTVDHDPGTSAAWVADCALASDVSVIPCVRILDPDGGSDLEASLAAHPTDASQVLVTWTSRTGPRADVWAAVTEDQGANWTVTKMENPDLGSDLPASSRYAFDTIATYGPDGRAYVFFGGQTQRAADYLPEPNDRITIASSADGGETWTYDLVTEDPGVFLWDAMDMAVAPDDGAMYAVAQSVSLRGVWFWKSPDGGDWSEPRPISILPADGYAYWPRVAAGPDGLVVVTAKTIATEPLVALVSHDAGATFERVTVLTRGTSGVLIGDPTWVDPATGSIRVAAAGSGGVVLAESDDRGVSWTEPVLLTPAPNGFDLRWSMAAGDSSGNRYALVSMGQDGGWLIHLVAWRDGEEPTVVPIVSDGHAQPRREGAGDEYGGLAVAADGSVWAAWSDSRFDGPETISVARLIPPSQEVTA